MDIYEYAKQMEKDGEAYYRDLARKTNNKGLKNILNTLADAEIKHFKVLQRMQEEDKTPLPDTTILSDVKNIFAKMKEEKESGDINISQIELYKKAQENEKESEAFYSVKANETDKQAQKEILLKIANEERTHYFILENIINFISRPETWLEDAEWYHLDEY